MASVSSESWKGVIGDTVFEEMEVSEFDTALLTSLLEESQTEDTEDERLGSVIKSLEAEINLNMTDSHGSIVATELGGHGIYEDCKLQDAVEGGFDCSGSYTSDVHDFSWIDVEMVSSSPSHDMRNWYMDSCTDEIVGMVEFGDVRDYSQFYYGASMEEHAYGSLWQETYDSVVYH